jgi:streptogrisin D
MSTRQISARPSDPRPRSIRVALRRLAGTGPARIGAVALLACGLVGAGVAAPSSAATPQDAPLSFDEAAEAYLSATYDLSPAQAERILDRQEAAQAATDTLRARLGERLVGAVVDEATGTLTVEVADRAAADVAVAAGVVARVDTAAARLEAAQRSLTRVVDALGVEGVAVSRDIAGDALVLQVPAGDRSPALTALVKRADSLPVDVRVEHTDGPVETLALYGGEDILLNGNQGRCSAGFNLRAGSAYYLLTAGHCGGDTWFDDGVPIGTTVVESFPGDDYKLIRIDDVAAVAPQGRVLYGSGTYDVSSAGQPPVGSTVCRTGSTTGTRCGSIQAYNATVTYAEGSVSGLVRTNVCAEPGDSGGPLFAANGVAVGITSGGSGNCRTGGTTFFQTVSEVTSRFGLSVL